MEFTGALVVEKGDMLLRNIHVHQEPDDIHVKPAVMGICASRVCCVTNGRIGGLHAVDTRKLPPTMERWCWAREHLAWSQRDSSCPDAYRDHNPKDSQGLSYERLPHTGS